MCTHQAQNGVKIAIPKILAIFCAWWVHIKWDLFFEFYGIWAVQRTLDD